MLRPPLSLTLGLLTAFGAAATASAQTGYSSGFETLNASAAGTVLTGQDSYTQPVTGGADFRVYTYAGNAIGMPANGATNTKFVAGTGPGNNVFARAQRDLSYGWAAGKWTIAFDTAVAFTGVLPTAQNVGSVSLQPSTTAKYFIALATWTDVNTAANWNANIIGFNAANTQVQYALPAAGFQNLGVKKWYRWEVDISFTTNEILEVRMKDLATNMTTAHTPSPTLYLFGGPTSSNPAPTAFRMFAGSSGTIPGAAGTVMAFDNVSLNPVSTGIKFGNSVVTVTVAAATPQGEMFEIDHQARTASKLTLSNAFATERPNCLTMADDARGWVGTNPLPANTPGNIFAISIDGAGNVTETKLNTTATAGGNVAQIAKVGSNLYFTTQNATGAGGILQHVPVAGGAVVTDVDLTTITGWNGLANSTAAIGTKVYVAAFDSGTAATTGSLVEWDTVTNTGTVALQLPKGKFLSGTAVFNTGIVYMDVNPDLANQLILVGVYGDVLYVDTVTKTVVQHDYSGFGTGTAGVSNLLNSGAYDRHTRDIVVGSRDGHVERICAGHSAEKIVPNVGSMPAGSVNGLANIPAVKGLDLNNGAGCAGNGGFTLTSADAYLPTGGNAGFKFACYSGTGGHPCVLGIGVSDPAFDLTPFGAPGCIVRSNLVLNLPAMLAGTGNGAGTASIAFSVPVSLIGGTVFTQWIEIQTVTKSNPVGVTVSNGRRITIQ